MIIEFTSGLPSEWTDLSNGLHRRQVQNLLEHGQDVTVYFDDKPVAVILTAHRYQLILNQLIGDLDS